jgi:uncharacterized protein YidB (DUF937 family)
MDLSKSLLLGLGALLVGNMLSRSGALTGATTQATAPQGPGAAPADGGLVGGLGGLLEKLQNAGHDDTVKSWLGDGQNKAIAPGQLGSALGQRTISNAAQQAGISEQDFLSQLAQALPQLVDKLTPNGRIPSLQEVAAALTQK